MNFFHGKTRRLLMVAGLALAVGHTPAAAQDAGQTAFRMAVAESTLRQGDIAAFYRSNGFSAIWVGDTPEHVARRAALIKALSSAGLHGLPTGVYDVEGLLAWMENARTPRELGAVEAALSLAFVRYARDVQSGVLRPSEIQELV